MAESTSVPNFRRMIVFPSPRKSLSGDGLKQESSRKVCWCMPRAALRPKAAAQNRLQCSAAGGGGPPCSVSAAGLSLERWTLYSAASHSHAWHFGVAGLRRLVLVLEQGAHLRTSNPLLSGHLQPCIFCIFICAFHPSPASPLHSLQNHKEEASPCFPPSRSEGAVQESQRGSGQMS